MNDRIPRMDRDLDFPQVANKIQGFIARQVRERGVDGVVLGISGGLDSSVVAKLAVQALDSSRVYGLILPDGNIFKQDVKDAELLAKCLKIKYRIINIGPLKKEALHVLPRNRLAQLNLVARLRMCMVYYYASLRKSIVLGTSDKSEVKLGYFTKYGDGAADLLPIADLYKTQVRKLAQYLQIPAPILAKKSSPSLHRGQTAEGEIGVTYDVIDEILDRIEQHKASPGKQKSVDFSGLDRASVERVLYLAGTNHHKSEMPPVCRID